MKLYNTMSMQKEEFVPIEPGKVRMYACGPTVYNYIHVGNARPIIMFDVLRRYLEYRGYEVTFVQNFTDVDDKIIKRANEECISSVQSHAVCPSFMSRSSGSAKTIELAWDGSQYVAELTDTNRVLSQFTFSASETGFHFSVSGNTLTITTDTAPSGNVTISATRSASRCGVLVWTD